ncbi:MAG: FAD-binding oxidoreductase [Alphaproteobacteria bacterium]|nr:FAD-binding oxidoreductase [Alphaproteobacteria bacterium]
MNPDTGHPPSLWAATATPAPSSPPLEGTAQADVVVIGAGYTGSSTALHLAERGVNVALLEAVEVGFGAGGRSMGLVNRHFRVLPSQIKKLVGEELGERMNRAFHAGSDIVFDIIARHGIACEAVRKGTLELGNTKRGFKELHAFYEEFSATGAPLEWLDGDRIASITGNKRYTGGFIDRRAGSIQPLGYVRGLARAAQGKGAVLHTHSRVQSIVPEGGRWRVDTARGTIRAERVVVATDAYSDDLMPEVRDCMVPMWANMAATEPLSANLRATIMPGGEAFGDTQIVRQYYRTDRDGRLIAVTLGHLINTRLSPVHRWAEAGIRKTYPHLGEQKIAYKWEGMLGLSHDFLPSLHEPAPGFYVPNGYSGRGITSATTVGKYLAERILGAPDSEFPLPLRSPRRARFRALRGFRYEAALHAGRLLAMVL